MLLVAQAVAAVVEDAGAEVPTGAGSSGPGIANPLRFLGLGRVAAGCWISAAGVMTLLQYQDFVPQAQRLFGGDPGTTDAPIRALLTLVVSAALIPIGFVLIAKGIGWMRRLQLPATGPAALARDEVVATLVKRQAPAFGDGAAQPYWPLRRWLADQLADLTWWHRDVMSRSVQGFVRSCAFALLLGVGYVVRPMLTNDDWTGPFPTGFVVMLIFVTAIWAALGLMLISSSGPRVESTEFQLPQRPENRQAPTHDVLESRPEMLQREPPGLGLTMGFVGIAAQCCLPTWWTLSPIGFPMLATSVIRHSAAIAGGILFFALGHRMVGSAAELLLHFRYTSTLVFIENTGQGLVGRTAAIRTDSRGLTGPRHIVATVVASDVREKAQRLMER